MSATLRRPGGVYCPHCRDHTTVADDGRCLFCDQTVLSGSTLNTKRGPAARNITPRVLRDAYELYLDGLSLRRVAAAIWPRTTYANERTLAVQLSEQWRQLGWPLRDRVAATIGAHYIHGRARRASRDAAYHHDIRVASGEIQDLQCAAIKTRYGKGRGEQCQSHALKGGTYCHAHEPARRDQRNAQLADMRTRSPRRARSAS